MMYRKHLGARRRVVFKQNGRAALLALALAAAAGPAARAQTGPPGADSTAVAPADTVATPAVAPAGAGSTASVPSPEFETYAVSGGGRYTAALTALYTSGTVERVLVSTGHTANLALGRRWLLPAAFNYSYGRQDGQLRERELLLLLTPAYRRGRWKFYVLGETEQSNLRAIDRRRVAGAGVGYQLYADTLNNEVGLSQFALYEDTRYLTELRRQVPRSSTRLKLRYSPGTLTFSALVFYQPSLRDPAGDYRLNSSSSLSFRVSSHLALTAAYAFSFESVFVENRSQTNSNLSVGFSYVAGK